MKNIKSETKGTVLTLTIDLSKSQGPSKSGKTMIIATSSGNQEIIPGVYLGVNCYRKA